MKKIKIIKDGMLMGEGGAKDERDLADAVQALAPMMAAMPGAQMVIEDAELEDIQKDVKKQYEKTYTYTVQINIRALNQESADKYLDEVLESIEAEDLAADVIESPEDDFYDYDDEYGDDDYGEEEDEDYDDEDSESLEEFFRHSKVLFK